MSRNSRSPTLRSTSLEKTACAKGLRDTYSGGSWLLCMVMPEPSKRKCSTCVFFGTRKCSKVSAGYDLVLPTDLACPDYENARRRIAQVDMAKIIEEIAAELPEAMPYESEEALYSSIVTYLKGHIVLEDENEYYLVTSFILATWKVVHLNEACYLVIVAPKGHGKTRLVELLYELCCKAIMASYATRAASMRLMEAGEITLLLDEGEIVLKATEPDELTALFTSGQRRGQKMIIVEEVAEQTPDGKKISSKRPVLRDVFGFKVVASREDVFDAIVDRAFEIVLPKAKPKNRRIDKERAKTLRAQLRYYAEHGPVYEPQIPEKTEALMDGRMVELTEVLLRTTPPEYSLRIMQVALKEVKERIERITDTIEAKLLAIIKDMLEDPEELKEIERLGLIPTTKIAEAYNEKHKDPKWVLTNDYAGRVLSRLKLQRKRHKEGKIGIRGFKYDEKKLTALYERFFTSINPEDLDHLGATGATTATTVERPPTPVKVFGDKAEDYFHSEGESLHIGGPAGPSGPDLLPEPGFDKVGLIERKNEPLARFKCKLCGVGLGYFSSREALKEHLMVAHQVEEEQE